MRLTIKLNSSARRLDMRESYGVQTVPVDKGIFSGWLFVLFMANVSFGGVCGPSYRGAVVNYNP